MDEESKALVEWAKSYIPEENVLQLSKSDYIVDIKKYLTVYAHRMEVSVDKPLLFEVYKSKLIVIKEKLDSFLN